MWSLAGLVRPWGSLGACSDAVTGFGVDRAGQVTTPSGLVVELWRVGGFHFSGDHLHVDVFVVRHGSVANGTFIVDAFGMQLAAAKLAKPPILFAIYFRLPITRPLPIIRPAHTRSSCSAETTHSYAHLDADPMRRAVETIDATISARMEENKGADVLMLQKVGRKS
jgi:hypothetical protein